MFDIIAGSSAKNRKKGSEFFPFRPYYASVSPGVKNSDFYFVKDVLGSLYYCPASRLIINKNEYGNFCSEVSEYLSLYRERRVMIGGVPKLEGHSLRDLSRFDRDYSKFVLEILSVARMPLYIGGGSLKKMVKFYFPFLSNFNVVRQKKYLGLNALLFINSKDDRNVIYVVINDMLTSRDWEYLPLTRKVIQSVNLTEFSRLSQFFSDDCGLGLYNWRSFEGCFN